MLLAAPVLHHKAEVVGVEEKALGVPRPRRPQVDQEHHRELQPLGRVDREQRDRFGARSLFCGLADGQLGIDHLVQVAHEVADPSQRQVAFEATRELKDLAQVEKGSRAAVSVGTELRPPQITALFEQAIENVGHRERIA